MSCVDMKELIELLLLSDKKIYDFYNHFARRAAEIIFGHKGHMKRNHTVLREEIERLLKKFSSRFYFLLHLNIQNAQALAQRKMDSLLMKHPHRELTYQPVALEKVKVRLSERIWDLSKQNGRLIEWYVKYGFKEGTSASQISKDLREFLKEPDKLFRRVRDQRGQLELSKTAREYHPGRGVYRSSYKNALRLSRTEVNMAYRKAEHERWEALPFVLGIEIKRSKSRQEDSCLCDPLQGRYPKNFLFLGWHPQCLCQAIPLMLTREEFIQYNKTGKIHPSKYIQTISQKAQEYLDKYAGRIRSWKNTPYFIKENFQYIEGKGYRFKGL